jgi:DMSO/TMAO reductase YedYZ heme-binding membrane subunit
VPRRYQDAAGAFAWLSMLVVVALWVAGGGIHDLGDLLGASGLTTLGRITGLVAADLLLIQVLLMARIPLVERAYGQDELARKHRLVGFWSFNLMLAHVVLITLGYAASARTEIVGEFLRLVLTYPGMLLGLAGSAALTLVAVTSIKMARARLRYEDWHLLHLYAYLGVGLALPHELWTGADFLTSPLATLYWWTLWGAAAGAVLLWRVALPLYRSAWHRLVVERV